MKGTLLSLLAVMAMAIPNVYGQTNTSLRVLFYGPMVQGMEAPVEFINNHPDEFLPISEAPGGSAIWDTQRWVDATVADFQQFDAIVFSDVGLFGQDPDPMTIAMATRAIWGSAINGNIFITASDPLHDALIEGSESPARFFRQGVRFAARQPSRGHSRTGLYLALDHRLYGDSIGDFQRPTEVDLLSWFGSFQAILSGAERSRQTVARLVIDHPILNALGMDAGNWIGSVSQGFLAWPPSFFPVACDTQAFQTTPASLFTPSLDAETGYRAAMPMAPLVYALARPVDPNEFRRLDVVTPNGAFDPSGSCRFELNFTYAQWPNPIHSPAYPTPVVGWTVVEGPHKGLQGVCNRSLGIDGAPLGACIGSYKGNPALITPENRVDRVRVFVDANNNDRFDGYEYGSPGSNDLPPSSPVEYATELLVQWGTVRVTVSMADSLATEGSADTAAFTLARTGPVQDPLAVKLVATGTAVPDIDYYLSVHGSTEGLASSNPTVVIPAGASSVRIVVNPIDDADLEGPETVQLSIQDDPLTYAVGGSGFSVVKINDNDQPLIQVEKLADASESALNSPGVWRIRAVPGLLQSELLVYFTLSGTAQRDVDYRIDLPTQGQPEDAAWMNEMGTGTAWLTAVKPYVDIRLYPLQDSRTEGTESAVLTLLDCPTYRRDSASAAAINIQCDDTPQLPAAGYAIIDLGDVAHPQSTAVAITSGSQPKVAGNYVPPGSASPMLRAFRWANGVYLNIPAPAGLPASHSMVAQGMNHAGWIVGSATAGLPLTPQHYYWLFDGQRTRVLDALFAPEPGLGPFAINDTGWVVGSIRNAQAKYRPICWSPDGTPFELGTLSRDFDVDALAYAIGSSAGGHRVIGESHFDLNAPDTVTRALHAFRTSAGSEPGVLFADTDDLGNALQSDTSASAAYAINGWSEIVGASASSASETKAAYKDGNSGKHRGWKLFGVLPGGSGAGRSAQALGINDRGLAVGWSRSSLSPGAPTSAVAWDNYHPHAAVDLNKRIPASAQSLWKLQTAQGINDQGWIMGVGTYNGARHAYLLKPN